MKGNNELRLNEATMIEAIQLWLDSKMLGCAPKVTGVEMADGSSYSKTFKIDVDGDAKPTAPIV